MESIKSIKWCIDDNEMLGCLNNFALCISPQVIKTELEDDDSGLSYDHKELGYVLIIDDLDEGRKGYCTFVCLEDVMFFINNYLRLCKSITEANNLYKSFCVSQEVIDVKGYTS